MPPRSAAVKLWLSEHRKKYPRSKLPKAPDWAKKEWVSFEEARFAVELLTNYIELSDRKGNLPKKHADLVSEIKRFFPVEIWNKYPDKCELQDIVRASREYHRRREYDKRRREGGGSE